MHTPPEPTLDAALVWLRRDLRVDDHAALWHALRAARRVWCGFVFDRAILDPLPRADRRVEFIRDSLVGVDAELRALAASHGVEGAGLIVRHGQAVDEIVALARSLGVQAVYASHDDDPQALARDARARGALADAGIVLHTCKDHVIFERDEVLTASGAPFSVFTPYRNAWLRKLEPSHLEPYPVARHAGALAPRPAGEHGVPVLSELGFEPTNLHQLRLPSGPAGAQELLDDFLDRIDRYHEARDFPAVKGPSYLGPHLRFGTISVRRLVREAQQRAAAGSRGAEAWLAELVWREFYHQVLHHHPHVVGHAFRPAHDRIRWEHGRKADEQFAAWCEGRTGYPLVDAAMHQITQTGYMHNRLRMVVASFLTKDLGIDWRRGEAWFAERLNDYELASNNGGWQWAASTGCDAQPWFRIFNPVTQSRRFDPEGRFVRRYLPQLAGLPDKLVHAPWLARPADLEAAGVALGRDYPQPIVDHAAARERTLARYAEVKMPAPR
ncbi:MAG: deoxyribodipyrimidine photo-lyase [Rhodoferax sp.]|jgi:deoxyribodipyrimidine photo-lyase|nr:deoxyribodipyrimidine photo-lyase [Rhodoferax sp.]MCP5289638.1 deoxyribodipyrimidine photo-lyase [Burkholderiaceae bacterium]